MSLSTLRIDIEIVNKLFCQITFKETGTIAFISLSNNFEEEEAEVQTAIESLSTEELQMLDLVLAKILDNYMIESITDWCVFD
jgi:uracil phosphoribosyltransferase